MNIPNVDRLYKTVEVVVPLSILQYGELERHLHSLGTSGFVRMHFRTPPRKPNFVELNFYYNVTADEESRLIQALTDFAATIPEKPAQTVADPNAWARRTEAVVRSMKNQRGAQRRAAMNMRFGRR